MRGEDNTMDTSPQVTHHRSPLAVILFIITATTLPCSLIGYHFVMWFMGQMAVASESANFLAWFDKFSLLPQVIVLLIIIAPLAWFAKDDRFRPIYQSWFIAILFALPALAFRLSPTRKLSPQNCLGNRLRDRFIFAALNLVQL